ncbi:MAG: CxxxxCH/CxxCH domain-containing protein [Deltaproteobacteria bacterium]|nr:CxxxxCH/CxxCH domain-containing protein [Deltaproteobacteria bacterium]
MRARFVLPLGLVAVVLGCSGGSGGTGEEPLPDALDDAAPGADVVSADGEGVDTSAGDTGVPPEDSVVPDASVDDADASTDGDTSIDDAGDTMTGDAPLGEVADDAYADTGADTGADSGATAVCTMCHGDKATGNPAPPRAIGGSTVTTTPGVGAHASHLGSSAWRRDVVCTDCHVVPTDPGHANGVKDFAWSAVATTGGATPMYDTTKHSCTGVYCHGVTLAGAATGGTVKREPVFNQVDGSFSACGASCHTNPPGGGHPGNTACATCHGAVIATYDAATKTATWKDRSLHIDGIVELSTLTCTTCHGDAARGDPAPPKSTTGATATTAQGVGAHQAHLATSTWRKDLACTDCHAVPTSTTHFDGKTDFAWGALARTRASAPAYDFGTATCSTVYCHGNALMPAKSGATVARTPVWNVVDGTGDACGTACHTNPPGGTHAASDACASCHGAVIASWDATTKTATWKDRTLHVNGVVETSTLTCTSCHGDPAMNEAPPKGTKGETLTSQAAVGAHQTHLASSTWHRDVVCTDCHVKPVSMSHATGTTDFSWSAVSSADGASPAYAAGTCSGVYCHGATLLAAVSGGTVKRAPVWTTVDGSYDACGASCHTNPPGGTHPASTACATCHGAVIASWDPATKTATWADRTRHVNGVVDTASLTCTSCHGTGTDPAPPLGTKGETLTTQKAVGAHQQHLALGSTWRKDLACNDCHAVPIVTTHSNATTDFAWGALSTTGGATPAYDSASATCSGAYCHGATLAAAIAGGTVKRTPSWTTVDGSYDACGASCHTNPPGGTHVSHSDCTICHSGVIASWNAATKVAAWTDRTLHVNGKIESHKYHDLTGWTSPGGGANHHGSNYFLTKQQKDEHGKLCTDCHGADYAGGSVGVSCNNASCHKGTDWRGCSFCHGTPPSQSNPPVGVGGETLKTTLAVGRHVAHLTASTTHAAFACSTCHVVPAAGNVAHALGYVPTANLETAGHHGDVAFSGGATGMTFNVAATQGIPVTARGTCLGACHSNGRGGAPAVTPYWAGGTWPVGSCGSCHAGTMGSLPGRHGTHDGEGLTCASCHPPATSSTHMNGGKDVAGTITGPLGGATTTEAPGTPGNPCGTVYSCTGSCHGKGHSDRCWR